jgi:transcriptional regulator with XRE-family HTH domain
MLRITRLREGKGWPKLELARQARLTPGLVTQIEAGRFRPYEVQLARIAKALDWAGDPGELLEEVDDAQN